jgi:hypothetical protein
MISCSVGKSTGDKSMSKSKKVLCNVTVTFRDDQKLIVNFDNVEAARDFVFKARFHDKVAEVTSNWHGYTLYKNADSALETVEFFAAGVK